MNNLKDKLKALPTTSGVYLMKDKDNNIIYVGKAKNLKRRVNQYFDTCEKNLKTELLVENIKDFEYILTNSEFDALMLENNLIKKHQPHYNILLKDGKNFAYLKINLKQKYPKFEITRKVKFNDGKYFGPYFNGISAKQVLDLIKYAYPLRTCNLSLTKPEKRECLKYSLHECSAPCTNKISEKEYNEIVKDAIEFLNGDTKKVEQILTEKMLNSASTENFERAIIYKQQLESLKLLNNKYTTQFATRVNLDVVGHYILGENVGVSILIIRNGKMIGADNFNVVNKLLNADAYLNLLIQYYSTNHLIPSEIVVNENFIDCNLLEQFFLENYSKKVSIKTSLKGTKKTLQNVANSNAREYLEKSLSKENLKQERTINACVKLKEKLNLTQTPYRIEAYDISNISGTNKVSSMVVFTNGEPDYKMYRKFKIKTVEGIDDFKSMAETLKRRMEELKKGEDISFKTKPNLILIDGGKGQLSSASEEIRKYNFNIDLISLAKKNEEVFKENSSFPIILDKTDYSLQLLQRVRDEAHRFAITFHRSLRHKSELTSVLTKIDGIGKTKAKNLLKQFKTLENIKKASVEELTKIRGVTKTQALEIKKLLI